MTPESSLGNEKQSRTSVFNPDVGEAMWSCSLMRLKDSQMFFIIQLHALAPRMASSCPFAPEKECVSRSQMDHILLTQYHRYVLCCDSFGFSPGSSLC